MRQVLSLCFLLMSCAGIAEAQPSSEKDIQLSWEMRKRMAQTSILRDYPARCIGPSVQGSRVVDIEVHPSNTNEFYVAFASGGIFKTTNNGTTFKPIFDNVDALGIGDFAISPTRPEVIFAGTGEKNSSRTCYPGTGLYKTIDGGKTWTKSGLTDSHHISRIIFHPNDENIAWVSSMGALYSHNQERGVYKTIDGGTTWKKVLYINDSTGIIDLIINPVNPNQLWAASWERTRKAWHIKASGPGSAIWYSENGGETWEKRVNGFPQDQFVGRIGLQVSISHPNILYAVLDNQQEVPDQKKLQKHNDMKVTAEKLKTLSSSEFLELPDADIEKMCVMYLPKKYTTSVIRDDIRNGKYTPLELAEYMIEWAGNLTKIVGAQVFRSDDSGVSWKKMNAYDLDGVYHSFGYYFGEIDIAPDDPEVLYLQGIPLLKSKDGGASWHRIDTLSGNAEVHVDHHALWINPKDPKHLLLGNDGGVYQSYDEGASWKHINNIPAGQFYTVNVDMERPYNVYGGLQDNGVWRGASDGSYWKPLFTGDGMFVAPDPRNNMTVYTGFHYGNYFRLEMDKKKSVKITPHHGIRETPLRWNWRTPLILSPYNPDVVYMAAQRVFRSTDKGTSWQTISPDLTRNRKYGNVMMSTITDLAESPLRQGLLYAGTDDGNVWVTQDGGNKWEPIHNGLPDGRWVSSVFPSPHKEGTVFVSLNGAREDEYDTYLFASHDFGKSWIPVKGNLPESVANVLIQDPIVPNILYCGLDNGTYTSLDFGTTWYLINKMLSVPSYDMLIHPREHELVVGTHGRSIFVMDVKPLQGLAKLGQKKQVIGFAPQSIQFKESWSEAQPDWERPVKPKVELLYFTPKASSKVRIEIFDSQGKSVKKLESISRRGFNVVPWNMTPDPTGDVLPLSGKGGYKIRFTTGREKHEVNWEVK